YILFDQQEIGTLGFLLRRYKTSPWRKLFKQKEHELLLQAKVEPGNVRLAQIAPTYQATASNHDRVHDGGMALFHEYFEPGYPGIVYDKKQSEQGTRFFYKRNRDVLTVLEDADTQPMLTNAYRWARVSDVLNLVQED